MKTKRPIELRNASRACGIAWQRRDEMIEAEDAAGVEAMNLACDLLDYHQHTIYQMWQYMGGTNDIDSIALFGVGDSPTDPQLDGTEPSPIISGGEVLYITNPTGNDDIPF